MNISLELIFVALMAMVVVWFGLIIWLFRRLRTRHPETYETIGSPTLFWNNSMRNNWLFFTFLFSAKHRQLQDAATTRACIFMRIWLIAYVLLIAVMFFQFHDRF
jgi:hypothetical protein